MKVLVILFVALFGLATSSNELSQDLNEFIGILPLDKINEIVLKYIDDEEFKNIIMYVLHGEEFKNLVLESETIQEYLKLLNYLEDSGLEIYAYLNLLHQAIGIKPIVPPSRIARSKRSTRVTWKEIRDEIRAVLPKKQIADLHDSKMINSKAYKYFSDRIETDEIEILITNVNDNKDIQRILNTLMEHGVDIKDNTIFYLEIFGFRPFQ